MFAYQPLALCDPEVALVWAAWPLFTDGAALANVERRSSLGYGETLSTTQRGTMSPLSF